MADWTPGPWVICEREVDIARREYTFRLSESDTDRRCARCYHLRIDRAGCGQLGIEIANPMKSACPLYREDGN